MQLYSILLAGGSGTRLWPLSRRLLPKQLLPFTSSETLLQQTARRLLKITTANRIWTVTHENHLKDVEQQLRQVDTTLTSSLLAEPKANNTLPAIAWAASEIFRKDPFSLIFVSPSDHQIQDQIAFEKTIAQAVSAAAGGFLVTFGIQPSRADTGYGYIEAGPAANSDSQAFKVLRFVEKPDFQTALTYFQSGRYYWNAGLFLFQTRVFLEELQKWEPVLYEAVVKRPREIPKIYESLKSISIDYGIMEKTDKAVVVPSKFGWSDLGNWDAIYETSPKDANQNVLQGDVIALETESSLILGKKGLVAAIGLKDFVVVQTDDALLISSREKVQDVKRIVDSLKEKNSSLIELHRTVTRPWGHYTVLEEGEDFKIKRIVVNPGQKLSLQKHTYRSEHWVVIQGKARVQKGDQEIFLSENESTFISQNEKHRLENPFQEPLVIIEVQTGSYVGEDDIQRFDDIYGRS